MDEEELKKQSLKESVFKNQSSLDMSYVTPKLLGREDVLIYNYRRILEENDLILIQIIILNSINFFYCSHARIFKHSYSLINYNRKDKQVSNFS